jgi:acetyl esterase/lipase
MLRRGEGLLMKAIVAAMCGVLASTAAHAQSMTPAKVNALPHSEPYIRASYGFGPIQVGELRLPPGKGPFPVAIIFHGGCYLKAMADMNMMSPLATALTARGFATWNVEYRALGDEGAGWPGTFEDWALAADHLRFLAKTEPLDLKRVIAVGHSAGGHAAVWLAARPQLSGKLKGDNPVPIKAVVNIDGPEDVALYEPHQRQICDGQDVLDQMLGGAPQAAADHWRDGNPAQRLPLHAHQLLVSSALMSGAAADAYAARARAAGDKVDVLKLDAGHFDPIAPGTPAWKQVEDFIVDNALK